MKTEYISHAEYACEFCNYKDTNSQTMTHHEHNHKRTAEYRFGQPVIVNTGASRAEQRAFVVSADVRNCKVMVELEGGERAWAHIDTIIDRAG
jgi:hypothetical protein